MTGLSDSLARTGLQLLGWRSRYVRTTAGRIHFLEARGRGRTDVVLLHGLSACGAHYAPLLTRLLPAARRVLAPDLLAHGFSDVPRPGALCAESIRAATRESLDALLDQPALVVGNSLGGHAAIDYALARPAHVRALALLSPAGAPLCDADTTALRDRFEMRTHAHAERFVAALFAKRNAIAPLYALGVRRKLGAAPVRELIDNLDAADALRPEELAGLTMPVLLLWGAQERILPPAALAFFRAHLPAHARIERPEGMGHSPHLDDSPRLAARLRAYLAELEA